MSGVPQAIAAEVLKAALDTYALERALGGELHENALEAAIAAGIRVSEQRVLDRLARRAETYAAEIDAADGDEDGTPPFAAALTWFASKIRAELEVDPSGKYRPVPGDVVEVTIIGPVATWHDLCDGCKQEKEHPTAWSVTDDATGLEFSFPARGGSKPQVRVLARAEEQEQEKEEQ